MAHSALNKDKSLYRLPDFQSVSYHAIVNNASCEPDVVKDAIKKLAPVWAVNKKNGQSVFLILSE